MTSAGVGCLPARSCRHRRLYVGLVAVVVELDYALLTAQAAKLK